MTTVSVYFGQPGLLPSGSYYNSDTFSSATLGMPDADRALLPGNPIDTMFKIGTDGTLTLDFTKQEIDEFFFLETHDPNLDFFGSGAVNIAFRLTGTLHLLADGTVDPSSVSLYGFAGGDYAYIGGPLTQLVPEPSSLTLLGLGTLCLLGYGWRRRRAVAAAC